MRQGMPIFAIHDASGGTHRGCAAQVVPPTPLVLELTGSTRILAARICAIVRRMTSVDYTYDPEERYGAIGALLEHDSEGASFPPADLRYESNKRAACTTRTERGSCAELSWDPVTRYNALAWTFKAPRKCQPTAHAPPRQHTPLTSICTDNARLDLAPCLLLAS